MLPLNAIRWGHDAPQPARRELRAGPLTMLFESGDLRYIRLGDREVLRRVYVAVRDHNWDTIPIAISDLNVEQSDNSFTITFQADHRQGAIDFGWRGTITGDAQGTVTFAMDGAARTAFLRNRIGFCILHPPDGCAGHSCVVEHDYGMRVTDEFPYHISPNQPFVEMRAIAHEVAPDTWAEVRFSGDIFEMEDQRNWTDASYKTYCTPLRLPYPAPIAAGETVAQSVLLTLTGGERSEESMESEVDTPVVVTVGDEPLGPLPRIGLGVASHGQPLSDKEIARLRALNLAHLRVNLSFGRNDWPATLAQAIDEARAVGAELEVAIFLSGNGDGDRFALDTLVEIAPPVARWLVFELDYIVTRSERVYYVRQSLKSAFPGSTFGGGTDAYFTELNRARPRPDLLDFVAYSINPQVHAFDDASLVETLPMQAATVESARQFVGDIPVAISPITLLPRFNPNATGPQPAPDPTQLPPEVDPRQPSLFTAAWTVGSLAALAAARVASATYYETTGPRGIMETANGSPWPAFHSLPGTVFPVYHIFAALGTLRDGEALPVTTSDPLRATALAIRHQDQTRILLANLLPEPQTITLHTTGDLATVRYLDETTALDAMQAPSEFRTLPGSEHAIVAGALTLHLLPYAVAEISLAS